LAWANVGQIEVPVVAAAVVGTAAVVALAGCVVVVEGDDVEAVVELLPDPQAVNTNPAIRAQTAKVVRVFTGKTPRQAHGDTSGHALNSRPSRRLGTV
jgi:hypothetical protein